MVLGHGLVVQPAGGGGTPPLRRSVRKPPASGLHLDGKIAYETSYVQTTRPGGGPRDKGWLGLSDTPNSIPPTNIKPPSI